MTASDTRLRPSGAARVFHFASKFATAGALLGCALAMLLVGCHKTLQPTSSEPSPPSPATLTLTTSDDRTISPFDPPAKLHVFLFARTDCPISNRYAPEVRRIAEKYEASGVKFTLVYPDPDVTSNAIAEHLRDYAYPCGGLHDPQHELVKLAGATVTPEAAVFDQQQTLIYCGRIDDRFADFGTERASPTSHDLIDAIDRGLAQNPSDCVRTEAIGCYIGDLR